MGQHLILDLGVLYTPLSDISKPLNQTMPLAPLYPKNLLL